MLFYFDVSYLIGILIFQFLTHEKESLQAAAYF